MNRPECDRVAERLLAGESLAGDPQLAAHAGSCMHCFRMAADLRDAPRIARLLRQAQPDQDADPGDAFWEKFPQTVAAAWERSRGPAAAPAPRAGSSNAPGRSRFAGFIRRPAPAALAGAALAGLLVFALARPMVHAPAVRAPAARPLTAVAVGAGEDTPEIVPGEEAGEEAGEEDRLEVEQRLGTLEEADLNTLLADMDKDEDEDTALAPVATDLEREPAVSLAEEVETLGADDLQALDQALRKGSSI